MWFLNLADQKLYGRAILHHFLDRAVSDAFKNAGFLFRRKMGREAYVRLEFCQRQRTARAGIGRAGDIYAFGRDAQSLAGFLGIDCSTGGEDA